ncbi:MAG: hypothetical protein ACXVGQ_00440 [Mycobacteriaceae bacterium]
MVIAGALTMAGCGGSGAASAHPPQAAATTETASATMSATTTAAAPLPTPTAMSVAQARAFYLASAAANNKACDPLMAVVRQGAGLAKLKPTAQECGAANWAFAARLRGALWPAVAATDVKALAAAIVDEQDSWNVLAHQTSVAAFMAILDAPQLSAKAANHVRADLNLAPVQ